MVSCVLALPAAGETGPDNVCGGVLATGWVTGDMIPRYLPVRPCTVRRCHHVLIARSIVPTHCACVHATHCAHTRLLPYSGG